MEKAPIIIKPKKAAYTISFKFKCIHKVESGFSMHKVAEESKVDRASIKDWLKQKEKQLKKDFKRDNFRLQGIGKKPITLGIEEKLIKFIIECRHQQISLNSNEIIIKAKSLINALDGKSYIV